MFDTICTYPLPSDLFALAVHPSEPLTAVGLASGHVHTLRLPSINDSASILPPAPSSYPPTHSSLKNGGASTAETHSDGVGQVETAWKTRRHKGSCRTLAWSATGTHLFSAGTDNLVKVADTETGRVTSKIAVIAAEDGVVGRDRPCLIHALTPQTLILATDTEALYVYDLRADPTTFARDKPAQAYRPHNDYVSSLTPLPHSSASTSGFPKQWLTTGGTTVAVTDLRKGVLARSEDQDEELLSSTFVTGLGKRGTSVGEKALVGGSGGVLTLWERGQWDDLDERIWVDATNKESLDCVAVVPDGVSFEGLRERGSSSGPIGKGVLVGLGDGTIKGVRLGGKGNKVVGECRHDEAEGVVGLGFDVGGRMISGGGGAVKVWCERVEEEENEGGGGGGSDDEDGGDGDEVNGLGKRTVDGDDGDDNDDDNDDEDESSGEERRERRRKKRRKGGRGKNSAGPPHVTAFKGMD